MQNFQLPSMPKFRKLYIFSLKVLTITSPSHCSVSSINYFVQVVWLKVEICRLLEEKRSATLRLVLSLQLKDKVKEIVSTCVCGCFYIIIR